MSMSRRTRQGIRLGALLLLSCVTGLAVASWVEHKRNLDEEYSVYSAYLSEELLNNAHDWSVNGPVQVVVEDTTEVDGHLKFRLLYLLDNRVRFDELHDSTRVSFMVRNLFRTRILPEFVLPRLATAVLVSQSDIEANSYGSPEFQKKYPRNMGFITLSSIGFNPSRTQAVFYIGHFCGLCGGGGSVLMEKVNGKWKFRDMHSTWIS
jgi:hypothetical protein